MILHRMAVSILRVHELFASHICEILLSLTMAGACKKIPGSLEDLLVLVTYRQSENIQTT